MSADNGRFNEAEAARRLNISKATLMRARAAGLIHPMRHGPRTIRYTQAILDEYARSCPSDLDNIVARAIEQKKRFTRECGIYFLFSGDEIVYVGKTTNFASRLASHMFRKTFDSYAFLLAGRERLDTLEAALIDKLRPRLNIAMNNSNPTSRRTGYVSRRTP